MSNLDSDIQTAHQAYGVKGLLLACVILALPASVYAQEAVLSGTLTDTSGGVLPGVTVTATNEATGNTFMAVTDEGGRYRVSVRTGTYRIVCELSGFRTATQAGVQVLVGQTVTVSLQMAPGGVEETVTVTGETPLVNTTSSTLAGNVDPRQVAELPVAGRNFMALTLLAPGSRTTDQNAIQPLPDRGREGDVREFQINLDGQQVTRDMGTGTQPKYSQDMIAELQFVANRFDATMGRSSGVLVNIISKSGTNVHSGLVRANFRDSKFNAKDPVLEQVVPISNQQLSTALGGPIVKNKLHYFTNYEYEREPTTSIWNTEYPSFNIKLSGKKSIMKGGVRGDYQLSPNTRLMGKYSHTGTWRPFNTGSSSNHPSSTTNYRDYNTETYAKFTQVLSNRAVNEIEGGRAVYGFEEAPLTNWSNHWQARNGVTNGSPRIRFRTFSMTPNQNVPRHQDQWVWNIKDSFTFSYDARGRHDLRAGAEFLYREQIQANRRFSGSEIDARGGPTPANIESLFPDPFNVDTWNLAALSPITRSIIIGVGDFDNWLDSGKLSAWVQDDWQVSDRLTLNLGMRWDVAIGAFAQVTLGPWEKPDDYNDWNNVQPRVGFAYKVDDRTVMRGGVGLYVADAISGDETQAKGNAQISIMRYQNDGRPDFTSNPTNGRPLPTFDEAQTQFCHVTNGVPGCLYLDLIEVILDPKYEQLARNWQASIGVARQVGDTLGLEVDYIYNHATHEKGTADNINLTYDPATGVNYPFSDESRRFNPLWGAVSASVHMGRSETQELRFAVNKRFRNRWQASGNYALRWFWDAEPHPFSGLEPVPFPVAKDLGGEWSLAEDDQRHRATFSAIWEVGRGFQVSMLQYIGSGVQQRNRWGSDVRDIDGNGGTERLRPDGTIVPRNTIVGPSASRTDLRVQQRIPLGGRAAIDFIGEVFNMFNRPNYNIEVRENNHRYLEYTSGEYRSAQVGFRVTF